MGTMGHADFEDVTRNDWKDSSIHLIDGQPDQEIIRGATCVVAASNAKASSIHESDYKCDGTNDQVEIQDAIDALPTGGGSVILSEGTFYIAAPIDPSISYLTLKGQGKSTLLYLVDGSDCSVIEGTGNGLLYPTFEHFRIDGNNAGQSGVSYGIHMSGFRNGVLSHIRVDNALTDGVKLDDGAGEGWQWYIEWVYCDASGVHGFNIGNENTDLNFCFGNHSVAGDGFRISDAVVTLYSCNAEANAAFGVNTVGTHHTNIIGGAYLTNDVNIQFYASADCSISGNAYIHDSTAENVLIYSSAGTQALRNKAIGNHIVNGTYSVREATAGGGTNPNYSQVGFNTVSGASVNPVTLLGANSEDNHNIKI